MGAALAGLGDTEVLEAKTDGLFPKHAPLGEGKGVFPGRVVWIHEPGVVSWNGMDYWWKPENYKGDELLAMTRAGIIDLTGAASAAEAWNSLFEYKNKRDGESGGYRPGQKIAIKVNMNGAGEYNDDPHGNIASAYGNASVLKALLLSLVQDAGVEAKDITIFDTCRIFPDYMRAMCSEGAFAGTNFRYRDPGGPNDAVADKNAPIEWSGDIRGEKTWFPKCATEAAYLINLANLKGHSWGLTLGAKNHFGSFINYERRRTPQAAGLHDNIINGKTNEYSALTDLIARRELNGKTILYMLDAIITAPSETGSITPSKSRWQMPPFNNQFPCSLFFSQDPVALDSVGADFLTNEPTMLKYNSVLGRKRAMENYLHEAALISSPPSGTVYTDGHGNNPGSLGVHEHWNNASEKLYSKNRGEKSGIELIYKKI